MLGFEHFTLGGGLFDYCLLLSLSSFFTARPSFVAYLSLTATGTPYKASLIVISPMTVCPFSSAMANTAGLRFSPVGTPSLAISLGLFLPS